MNDRILCDTCRHSKFIGSPTRVRCAAESGAVVRMARIKPGQSPMYVCMDYEAREVDDDR